jgi:hypothetical protein
MLRGIFQGISSVFNFIVSAVKHGLGIGQTAEVLEETGLPQPITPLSEIMDEIERGIAAREELYALNPWDTIPENMFTYADINFKQPYVYRLKIDYTTPEGYKVYGRWLQIESDQRLSRIDLTTKLYDMLTEGWYGEEVQTYDIQEYEFLTNIGG